MINVGWRHDHHDESDIVEQIRELVQGRAVLPLQEGPEDIKRFGQEP
jgi:hypothetical protein